MVSPKTRSVIWGKGAGHCYFPGCNESLIGDLVAGNEDANFGFVAHIVAETPGGPRGDPVRSPLLEDEPSNLVLMCGVHHKLIDVDEIDDYPEQRLLEIKAAHEDRIAIVTAIAPDRSSHVLRYGAKIGDHESLVSFARTRLAMIPDRYPAEGRSIGIEILGSAATDGEESFWATEPANLERQFEQRVRSRLSAREISHLSIFALGPIPLLIKLGVLLGDITPADVYQLHREPAGWAWARDRAPMKVSVARPGDVRAKIALKLSVSDEITDDRVRAVLGEDCSIWSLSVADAHNDIVRDPADLLEFRRSIRALMGEIKRIHGGGGEIHVFPAVPVSIAVEFGRVRMPKADLPLVLYDQVAGTGFIQRLRIG